MKKNDKNKMPTSIKVILWISVVVALIVLTAFFIHQTYDRSLPFATDIIGQYGDFVGGFIGTIVSVSLLYYTLQSQIKDSTRNSQIYTTQQLNEMFFRLLQEYNSLVETLKVTYNDGADDGTPINLQGKEALHYFYETLKNEAKEECPTIERKIAVEYYKSFYSMYQDFTPPYFRVLYRMFNLITEAEIEESQRVQYAKLLRAQFTSTEVIFMRYNAMTQLGKNFRNYINEYNLLKHIRPLELMEFNKYSNFFDVSLREKANETLYIIRKNIHTLYQDSNCRSRAYTSYKAKYKINFSKVNDDEFKFDFHRRINIVIGKYDDFSCYDAVTIQHIEELIEYWLKEIFVFSNFSEYNKGVCFNSNIIQNGNSTEHFSINVKSKTGDKLRISRLPKINHLN